MIVTILAFTYLIIAMMFLLPFALPAFFVRFFAFRNSMSIVIYRLAQLWAWSVIKIIRCQITVTGRENIPKKGGICFVSNHCGFFDIVLLMAYCSRPAGFVAKKELMFIPFLNIWIYMLGGYFLDRSNPRKASITIRKGINRIKAGGGMIIFPEGHRSKGCGLLPFHPGALKLATSAQAPIIPVAIKGSYEVFEKTYRLKKYPLKLVFCEPVFTADLPVSERKQVLSDRIYSIIKEKLDEINDA